MPSSDIFNQKPKKRGSSSKFTLHDVTSASGNLQRYQGFPHIILLCLKRKTQPYKQIQQC